jgi:hypothetical protein
MSSGLSLTETKGEDRGVSALLLTVYCPSIIKSQCSSQHLPEQ